MKTIVHLMPSSSRNTPRFIRFLDTMECADCHVFLIYGVRTPRVPLDEARKDCHIVGDSFLELAKVLFRYRRAKKIIAHGLFSYKLFGILFFYRPVVSKLYWMIWGGDLYDYMNERRSFKAKVVFWVKKSILRDIRNIITYIPGDKDFAEIWYGMRAHYHPCIMYPGNLYKSPGTKGIDACNEPDSGRRLKVIVGNSGDPSNNHYEVFCALKSNRTAEFEVYCPLSYGDQKYIKRVVGLGREMFGSRFFPITEYVDLSDYVNLLSGMDVAIYNYGRQQGMGNIITMLGLNKIVFINGETTPWPFFRDIGVDILDTKVLVSHDFSNSYPIDNEEKIKSFFSEENLKDQLNEIFSGQ